MSAVIKDASQQNDKPLVSLRNLNKHYGDFAAVDNISLDIKDGEFLTFLGSSGSGKSTTLSMLAGFETPSSGEILVNGQSLVNVPPHKRDIGMVFQQFNLFPHLTVGENVMLAPQVVQKVPKAKAAELARAMLERVGLGEKFDAFPDRLSGGQQQRVAIARALAMSPKVLLCDEITSALDPELVNEVLAVVRQLAKEGMTLIMVTHEMRFAREVGDKLVFMHHGKVHEVGDPKVLFANPQTAELANFIGTVEAVA
ncbi:MAG: amino acid ABC transporter ATP-binding protein [Pseudomonas sp.]